MSVVETLFSRVDTTTVVIFLLVFLLGYYWLSKPSNLPPGPPGIPVFGNMMSIAGAGSDLMGLFKRWRKQYGDIYTIRMGSKYMIVINSYEIMRDAFVKNASVFSDRPDKLYSVRTLVAETGVGIVFLNGQAWKDLRRMTLMSLRDFGLGKTSLEHRVQEEARAVVEVLEKCQGQTLAVRPLMGKFSSNIICNIVLGNRFDYGDAVFLELIDMIRKSIEEPVLFAPVNFVSFLRYIPFCNKCQNPTMTITTVIYKCLELNCDIHIAEFNPFNAREKPPTVCDLFSRESISSEVPRVVTGFVKLNQIVEKILKDHEETYDPNEVRDFVDLYIKTRTEMNNSHLYNRANMRSLILDLLAAGTDTTATMLEWILLYLITHPEAQKRCQQDIDKVIGQGRMAMMEDRKDLPYIMAFITEVHRISAIAPLGVPHAAQEDAEIEGYSVPADTLIMINVREIHTEPTVWDEPDIFKPERFLNKDGEFCQPKENFIPFSAGPRMCLGEALARMELFILVTTLVQSFTFTMAQGQKPNLEGSIGSTYFAKQQPILATRR